MNVIDIVLLAVFLIAFIVGFKDGFIKKLFGTLGFVLAIYLAYNFSDKCGVIITSLFGVEEYFAGVIAGLLIFVVTTSSISIIVRLIKPVSDINNIINRLAGGITGIFQFAFFFSAVFYLLAVFNFPNKQLRKDSHLYGAVSPLFPLILKKTAMISNNKQKSSEIITKDSLKIDSLTVPQQSDSMKARIEVKK